MNFSYSKITSIRISTLTRSEEGVDKSTVKCDDWSTTGEILKSRIGKLLEDKSREYYLSTTSGVSHEMIQGLWAQSHDHADVHNHYRDLLCNCYELNAQIKDGLLLSLIVSDVEVEEELCNALIIVKLDDSQSFIKYRSAEEVSLSLEDGFALARINKIAMILDYNSDDGYPSYISSELARPQAKYWVDRVLQIKPVDQAYQPTEEYLQLAKSFIKDHVYQEPHGNQAEKHGVLYDAGEFFKRNENYDDQAWKKEILQNQPGRIEAWEQHKDTHSERTGRSLPESFGISNLAVKDNQRYFKSVLKLDKNFHVYIHGDRNKIEHGSELDGRKYYKLYYDEER